MKNLLKIEDLNYKNILKNISIQVENNKIITISGPNKCGKTTLIKILSGLIPDNKSIILEDVYLNSLEKTTLFKKIGFVIPNMSLPFIFNSVEQELLFILDNLGIDKEEKKRRYKKIITLFKLRPYALIDPNNLYLFIKTKLLLAMAVIRKPKLLLLDDICANLTKKETEEILAILKVLKEENITIIMTTTDLKESLISDKLIILDEGEIILSGKPLEILKEDSLLNKMGLSLPFMVDLSLKLKYYDLIDEIELDMERMVNKLWK